MWRLLRQARLQVAVRHACRPRIRPLQAAGFRGFSAPPGPYQEDRDQAREFVIERGYSPAVADGILTALVSPGSGIFPGKLLTAVQGLAGRWEVGEDAGLHALAKSVEQDLSAQEGKTLIRFHVQAPGAQPFPCEGFEGMCMPYMQHPQTKSGSRQARRVAEPAGSCLVPPARAMSSAVGDEAALRRRKVEKDSEQKKKEEEDDGEEVDVIDQEYVEYFRKKYGENPRSDILGIDGCALFMLIYIVVAGVIFTIIFLSMYARHREAFSNFPGMR
eukprot:s1526_g7.t3